MNGGLRLPASIAIDTEKRVQSATVTFHTPVLPELRIMVGCPTLRTRPVVPHVHAHLAHRPSRKAHYSWQDTQRVHTRGVASRDWEVVAQDPHLTRARLCMLAASVGTTRTFPASRYVTLA